MKRQPAVRRSQRIALLVAQPRATREPEGHWKYFTAVASCLAAVASLAAVLASWQANNIAADANRIARQNAQANPRATLVADLYPSQRSAYGPMCVERYGSDVVWTQDFVSVVDVSNAGALGVDLSELSGAVAPLQVPSSPDIMSIGVDLDTFGDDEALSSWLVYARVPDESATRLASAAPLPIHLDPGQTKRLALKGTSTWRMPGTMTPQQLEAATRLVNSYLGPTLMPQFLFSDGSIVEVEIDGPSPSPVAGPSIDKCPSGLPSPAWL
jgi:hypothetical protein